MSASQESGPNLSRWDSSAESEIKLSVARAKTVYQNLGAFTKGLLKTYVSDMVATETSPALPQEGEFEPPDKFVTMHPPGMHPPLMDLKDIRVLELHAGSFEDELHCTLHVCSLGFDLPPGPEDGSYTRDRLGFAISCEDYTLTWYTALSYVWGPPVFDKPLKCNGIRTAITGNLDLALRHLRQSDSPVNLWVDQISINQDDLKEKGLQVALMSKIYQRSWTTIVWLGEEADNSSEALESMRDFNAVFQYELDESAPNADFFAQHNLPKPGSQQWNDLNRLLARPWFQRVWVIQEVIAFLISSPVSSSNS